MPCDDGARTESAALFWTENFSLKSTESIHSIKIKMKFTVEKTVELKQKENNYFMLYLIVFSIFLQFFEVPFDSNMNRTKNRPLVRGQIR